MTNEPEDTKLDIVFFWKQNDTGIYGRRQEMLVKYLAKDPRIGRILQVDAPIDLRRWFAYPRSLGIRRTEALPVMWQTLRRKLGLENNGKVRSVTFTFLDSRRRGFRSLARALGLSMAAYGDYLAKHVQRHLDASHRTVFWVCPVVPAFLSICDQLKPDLVVADVIDDERKWPATRERKEALHRNYESVLRRADLAFANCEAVLHNTSRINPNVHLIANAAEIYGEEVWNCTRPRELAHIDGPIIGYTGNLEQPRMDLELVKAATKMRPDWNFVFIGSAHGNKEILRLASDRVRFLGVRHYRNAVRYMRHFDVAIVPHLDNDLTRHMNPLKLYVYASLDVPIVATPIANIGDLGPLVRTARTANEFIVQIERCLIEKSEGTHARRSDAWLAAHSWEARTARILDHMKDALAAKAKTRGPQLVS